MHEQRLSYGLRDGPKPEGNPEDISIGCEMVECMEPYSLYLTNLKKLNREVNSYNTRQITKIQEVKITMNLNF